MTHYFDTGILVKLYTAEPESPAVVEFVKRLGEPLFVSRFQRCEMISAFRLKVFRGECDARAANLTVEAIDADFRSGVLRPLPVDWDEVWEQCYRLSDAHAGATGCRTLDTVHVACGLLSRADEFVSSDRRQLALAEQTGLKVTNPCERG